MKKLLYFFVYLVYFSTPFESVGIISGISVVKLVTVLFLFVAILYYKKIPFPRNNFIYLFFAYTMFTILSTLWSIDKSNTFEYAALTILPSFIVTIFIFHAIQSKAHIEKIFKAYTWGSSIVAIIALYMFATGFRFADSTDEARLTVLGQDQNELSILLSFGIVSIIYLWRFTALNKKDKLFFLLLASLLAFVVLTTGSRTGFVILLTIAIILLLMYTKKGRILYMLPLVLIASVVLFNFLPDSIANRLLQTSSQIEDRNFTGRAYIWTLGWKAFQNEGAYIWGTGFKSFRTLMDNYYHWPKAPHNTYLVTIIELGIIGFILYMGMIVNLLKKVITLAKKNSVFYLLLLLPLLLAMFTLGLETRRWLFLFGVLILKLWQFQERSPIPPMTKK